MTQLRNKDREAVLEKVLKESFEPRFQAFAKAVEAAGRLDFAEKHPAFVRGMADPDLRPHMKCELFGRETPRIDEVKLSRPLYGKWSEPLMLKTWGFNTDQHSPHRFSGDTFVPSGYYFHITDPALIAEHKNAWADYQSAYATLSETMYSYTNREKFEADFPQFAKHLPAISKKVGLPTVQVDDVLRKLAMAGVPQEATA